MRQPIRLAKNLVNRHLIDLIFQKLKELAYFQIFRERGVLYLKFHVLVTILKN